jgi:glycosyltransferase involved in cell wall biosynthesis
MKKNPLVSIIIPTKNSASTIGACLKSIRNQTYKNIEIIVVDNNSSDKTKEISRKYTKIIFNKGPGRSTQRNFGAFKARGEGVLFIDSDMELSKNIVSDCILLLEKNKNIKGIIIPEESFGTSFWARCKKLERSFYLGIDWIEAARFFSRAVFIELKGYDKKLISGDDWDLSRRINAVYGIGRINSYIYHNEGKLQLSTLFKKKFYYGDKLKNYSDKIENKNEFTMQSSIVKRYKLFFSKPIELFKNPILGIGMLFMKMVEFIAVGTGYFLKEYK